MIAQELYEGREQTRIKHVVLGKYLERFTIIVGKSWDSVTYVDCFSCSLNVRSDALEDTSFAVALGKLRSARLTAQKVFNRTLAIRCLFLEKNPDSFARLKDFSKKQSDVEILPLNADFESAIPEILNFVGRGGSQTFPFFFIDPTGWKGFPMQAIKPLLCLRKCEVLINLMTSFIPRFIEREDGSLKEGFVDLFGDDSYLDQIRDKTGWEREAALVLHYKRKISETGGFPYVPVIVVPKPGENRTHFHLVYATRHIRGIEVFKAAEREALKILGQVRGDAKRRKREGRKGQGELFGGAELPDNDYTEELHDRYGDLAHESVKRILETRDTVPYDELYACAMQYPLVGVQDLHKWIGDVADIYDAGGNCKSPIICKNFLVVRRSPKS